LVHIRWLSEADKRWSSKAMHTLIRTDVHILEIMRPFA